MPAGRAEYVFTDVTAQFLGPASQRFRDFPFVRFETLDLERDPLIGKLRRGGRSQLRTGINEPDADGRLRESGIVSDEDMTVG